MRIFFLIVLVSVFVNALSLPQALRELHVNNTELQISKLQIAKSQQKQNQRKASQYGAIDGFGSITKYNKKRTLAPLAPPIAPGVATDDTLKSVGVSYSVLLFSGFKDSSQIELSNLATKIEQTKHKLTLSQLEFNVQALFCDIASLQKTLAASKEYQRALDKIDEFTQKEYELGKKSRLDVLKIKSNISKAETTIIELETKIAILRHSLSLLVYGEEREFAVESNELDVQTNTFMLTNLPQIQLASLGTKTKEKSLQSAKAAYYPKVMFNSTYNDIYGDGEKENVTTISLNLVWKLYDFGTTKAQIQEAKIEQIQAKLEVQNTKEQINHSIFEAQKNIQKNEQLLQSAKTNLELAQKTKDIEEVLYKQGQKDISDYLLSLALYAQSRANVVATHYALLQSKYYFNTLVKE